MGLEMTISHEDSPYKPSIIGYDESTPLRAGSVKRLTCESQGGNPLADLKWFKGKDEITSGFTISSKINGISSELTLIVKDSDNGATYRCEASNSATIKPLEASVKLTVFCEYFIYIRQFKINSSIIRIN